MQDRRPSKSLSIT